MNRWPKKPLGEIAQLVGGSTPSRENPLFWDGEIPWVTPTDLPAANNGVAGVSKSRDRITQAGLDNSSATQVPKGTVLFSSRATIGKVAVADVPLTTNQGFANFIPKPDVTSRFLAYALWVQREDIARLSGSTTFKEVSRSTLRRYQIPVPPLAEQKRLAKLLDEADELRKVRGQADRRTAELIPALFHEMFGDPEHTRYPVKQLIELVNPRRPITYGILKPGPEIEDGVPYVRVVDIKQSRLHVGQLHKTTEEIANQYRRSALCQGDILVTIRGTVGRTCIVPDELKGANITQDTARLAIVEGVDPIYVVEFLNTPWAQSWMSHHTQGQAVKGINLGDLKKLSVPVSPLSMQREFASRVAEIRALEAEQAASRRRLDDLFQSMLYRAFNGEL